MEGKNSTLTILDSHDRDSSWKNGWKTYVDSNPRASLHHVAGWYEVISESYSVKLRYLSAIAKDKTVGVLPLYHAEGILFRTNLYSLYGGALTDSQEIACLLYDRAKKILDEEGLGKLVIRASRDEIPGMNRAESSASFRLSLAERDVSIWDGLGKKTRWTLRQVEKENYQVEPVEVNENALFRFWEIYAFNMRRLGTPVMSRAYFISLKNVFGRNLRLFTIELDGLVVGGMLCLVHNHSIHNMYAAVMPEHQARNANYQLYWSAIEFAMQEKLKFFDFGISATGSGAYHFKTKWRGEELSMSSWSSSEPGSAASRKTSSINKLWSHLPLVICNSVGPVVRQRLPFG